LSTTHKTVIKFFMAAAECKRSTFSDPSNLTPSQFSFVKNPAKLFYVPTRGNVPRVPTKPAAHTTQKHLPDPLSDPKYVSIAMPQLSRYLAMRARNCRSTRPNWPTVPTLAVDVI
jgi:hypothetical protein